MTDLSKLTFFATSPHPCNYLPGEEATTVFVDPKAELDGETFSQLSELGFRRSGANVYMPRCSHCHACVPIRIPVESFVPSRSQKRCAKNNSDMKRVLVDSIDTDEHYELYERYINGRHSDGDMYPPSRSQYADFLTSEWGITQFMEYRVEDRLIAVSVADKLSDGISAIYAFFDPEESKRSLGVYNILSQIELCSSLGLPYVYLGYWIKKCQKMRYKVDYRPFQVLIDNCWITLSDYKPSPPVKKDNAI